MKSGGILFLLISSWLWHAQPKKFDYYTFEMPPAYVMKSGKTFVDFVKYNETKTAYAQITFYRAEAATSDLKSEFVKEWNSLVKKTTNVDAPDLSSSEPENGWVSTFGSKVIPSKNGNYVQTLILFAGNNLVTCISVRVTADGSFAQEVGEILESIELANPTSARPE